ncbi:MAG: hypothetical protein IT554_05830 [Sphingomonadaceae bacterium]|nr:hypothetical protein [Sphingomonadaceae bacterium]
MERSVFWMRPACRGFWLFSCRQMAAGALSVRLACPWLQVWFALKAPMFDAAGNLLRELSYEFGVFWNGLPCDEGGLAYGRSWRWQFFRFNPALHSTPAPR